MEGRLDEFGKRLQISMTAGQFTDASLAKEMTRLGFKVSRQMVGKWRKMKRANLDGEHLCVLGVIVGYSVRWLGLGSGTPIPIGMAEARKAQLTS